MSGAVGFGFMRGPDEGYREAVVRIARDAGHDRQCVDDFDDAVAAGEDEAFAALCALDARGLLDEMSLSPIVPAAKA